VPEQPLPGPAPYGHGSSDHRPSAAADPALAEEPADIKPSADPKPKDAVPLPGGNAQPKKLGRPGIPYTRKLLAEETRAVTLDKGLSPKSWDAVEVWFLSDERVQIRAGALTESRNYAEWGFEDRRTHKPNLAWILLRTMAEQGGTIKNGASMGGDWSKVEKQIQAIRKVLRNHFRIPEDPIPYVPNVGYTALFKLGRHLSFDT
jgi:hypothetical protein